MDVVRTASFALPLPDGWSDRTAVTLVSPAAPDGSAANVVVTRERLCDNLGLGGFADGQASLVREHAREFAVLSTEHATLGGERALVRLLRFRIEDEGPLLQLTACCVHDGYGYALFATAPEGRYAEVEPAFRAALAGFRFTAEPAGEAAR